MTGSINPILFGPGNPGLAARLAGNGGPTETIALLPGSPALGAGSSTITGVDVPTTDQRGLIRPEHGFGVVDFGAYEYQPTIYVNSANTSGTDNGATPATGFTTIQAAIRVAGDGSTILVETGNGYDESDVVSVPDLTIEADASQGATPVLDGTLLSASRFDGTGLSGSGFDVTAADVTISGLTIKNFSGYSAIVVQRGASLTLDGDVITDNSAASGGGIFNAGKLSLIDSEISSNNATGAGGGIYNSGGTVSNPGGTVSVSGGSIESNTAASGGGIYQAGGSLTITGSIVSGNTSYLDGGGIAAFGGTVAISGGTFASDGTGVLVSGSATSALISGASIIDNTTGILVENGASATITNDTIQTDTTGVLVGSGPGDTSTATINDNDFTGDTTGVDDIQSSGSIDATQNWWGSLHGPTTSANPGGDGAGVSGNVSFTPWIGVFTPGTGSGFNPTVSAYYAVPTELVFVPEPSSTASFGVTFAQQPELVAEDSSGNLGINFDSSTVPGSQVDLTLSAGPYLGTLSGTNPLDASGGIVTFTDLSINDAGVYHLVASALPSGNPWSNLITGGATSTSITINQIKPTVSVTDASNFYNGSPFAASATITPNDGLPSNELDGVPLTYTYYVGIGNGGTDLGSRAPKDAGTYTVYASYAGTTNYASASNYTTFTITPATLTITATTDSRVYNGLTTSSQTPAYQVSGEPANKLYGGDTLTGLTQAFASKNVLGTLGSTLVVQSGYTVTDGVSGADYNVVLQTAAGTIIKAGLSITAATNSKVYDATTSAAALPTITSGAVMPGDTASFTDTYSTKNVGTGLTLTPAGVVSDGNSGNNYSYTYVTVSTGVITSRALVVTALANSKTYDGTTGAVTIPKITSGVIQGTDTPNFTEIYSTRNVGTGLTLTPAGTVSDGFSGNDYSYTFIPVSTATISARRSRSPR